MKTKFNKRNMVAAAIAASSLALLSGCGSGGGTPVPPPPVAPGYGIGGGCVPINTTNTIPFTMTGMYIGSEQAGDMRVLGGMIPPGDQLATGTYGVTTLMNGGMVQPQGYNLANFRGARVDGTTISLSVTSANGAVPQQYPQQGYPYGGYPNTGYPTVGNSPTGQYNATGYIQVSQFIQQLLIQTAMGSTGYGINQPILNQQPGTYPGQYPVYNGGQICVNNVAISLQRTLSSNTQYPNWLYLGEVYFYLSGGATGSNGQHGLAINF
jgi:hypothetical protein